MSKRNNQLLSVDERAETFQNGVLVLQVVGGVMALLLFGFWLSMVLRSLYHPRMLRDGSIFPHLSVDWYPGLLALALLITTFVYFMNRLIETN